MIKNGIKKTNYRYGQYSINKLEYNSYRAMKQRCYNEKYRYYFRYGGRGIKVCYRWLGPDGFGNFLVDMGKRPNKSYSLDRINNDGDYMPDNCRWATQKTQVGNSSTVKTFEIDGIVDRASNHIKRYNISSSLYYKRLKQGMSQDEALKSPNDGIQRKININRQKAEAKINKCIECGNRCKNSAAKFCTRKCCMVWRNRNNKSSFNGWGK